MEKDEFDLDDELFNEDWLWQRIQKNLAEKKTNLNLEEYHLKAGIPERVWNLTHLKSLFIGEINSNTISSQIKNLIELETLSIKYNRLLDFPLVICELKNLTHLTLEYNGLTTIPPEISKLGKLKYLSLGNNEIKVLPEEIKYLKNLEELDVSENHLNYFPEFLFNLKRLREIDLSSNAIENIPASITSLNFVRKLNLSHNEIKSLPVSFASSLKEINDIPLYRNPFTDMPAIRGKNNVEIYNYLLSLNNKEESVSAIWEVSDSLKTSLQQYLNYFTEYLYNLTGEELQFDVVKTKDGLKLTTSPTDKLTIHDINNYLSIYISQKADTKIISPDKATNLQRYQTKEVLREWDFEKRQLDFKLETLADKVVFLNQEIADKNQIILDQRITISFFQDQNKHLLQFVMNPNPHGKQKYLPLVTDEEKQPINISLTGNSKATIFLHSAGSQVTLNKKIKNEIVERIAQAKEVVQNDNELSSDVKDQVIEVLAQMIVEAESGKASQSTLEKLLEIGSNISSIGSLAATLWPIFIGKPN